MTQHSKPDGRLAHTEALLAVIRAALARSPHGLSLRALVGIVGRPARTVQSGLRRLGVRAERIYRAPIL